MDDTFPAELRALAARLVSAADRASRRGMYGLEDRLREAAASARSWAASTEAES